MSFLHLCRLVERNFDVFKREVKDGELGDETNFNSSYMDREVDTDTIGVVDLLNVATAASGPTISNIQRAINGVHNFVGSSTSGTFDQDPSWTTDNIGTANESVKSRVDSVQAEVENLFTLAGTSIGDTDLGTFTGTIISDNGDIKAALQELETVLDGIQDGLDFQGTWNANTNTPTLTSSTGTKGHFYIVDTAGTTSLDGISDWAVGDWAVFDGTVWRKVDNTDAVSSVNGLTGVVVLDIDDVTPTTTKGDIIVENGSNAVRLGVGSDGQVLTANSSEATGVEWADATGGGGGAKSFITGDNSSFEGGVGDWVEFDDGAVSVPVDGTGGTASNITAAVTTASGEVLVDSQSLEIAKGAADAQGEGISVDFSIDPFEQGREIDVAFKYKTGSGYVANHYRVFVYDVTNTKTLSVPTADGDGSLPSASDGAQFTGTFVAASNSSSYRLILMGTSTDATAFDIFLDDFKVSPKSFFNGSISTPWEDVDSPTTNLTTNTSFAMRKRREGPDLLLECEWTVTGANTQPINVNFTLPDNLQIASAALSDEASYLYNSSGVFKASGGVPYPVYAEYLTDTTVAIGFGTVTGSDVRTNSVNPSSNDPVTFANGDSINLFMRIPIDGWGAGALLSNTQVSQQTIRASYYQDTVQSIGTSDVRINFGTKVEDTHGAVTTGVGSWVFAAPRDGTYFVESRLAPSSASNVRLSLYKNGSLFKSLGDQLAGGGGAQGGGAFVQLDEGDTISVRGQFGSTINSVSGQGNTYIDITSLPDFSRFGTFNDGKVAYLKDVQTSGTNGGGFTSGSWQTRALNTVEGDDHIVTLSSNQFTLKAGTYDIEAEAPANSVDDHKLRLRNITDSTDDIIGQVSRATTTNTHMVAASLVGRIVINADKTFELQHRCTTTKATDGFGRAASFGVSEVFAQIKILKVR